MLTSGEIVPYLVQRGLVSPHVVAEGNLEVQDASRRNRNYKVISDRSPSFIVKQGIGEGGRATVAHEGRVYELLPTLGGERGVARYLPQCFGHDDDRQVLVLELLRNAVSLREHHARRGRFSTSLAAAMGDALGAFHGSTRLETLRGDDRSRFPERRPWVLSIHRPDLQLYRDLSSGNVALIKIVQQFPQFCELLDELQREWRAETLIHFDIKGDNYLVVKPAGARGKNRLKMVDWETTAAGDPCWDAGSVFSDYLSSWLFSMPITGDAPPDRFMELARYPLQRMQPAMRAFWHSYVRRMRLDRTTSAHWLKRAVRYGAARLVQTAFEQMQASMRPAGNTICLLQLSVNVMRRPEDASAALLGIPFEDKN